METVAVIVYLIIFIAIFIRVIKFAKNLSGSVNKNINIVTREVKNEMENLIDEREILNTDSSLKDMFETNNNPIKEKSIGRKKI